MLPPRPFAIQLEGNTINSTGTIKVLNHNYFNGRLALEYVWIDWEHCNETDVLYEATHPTDDLTAATKGINRQA